MCECECERETERLIKWEEKEEICSYLKRDEKKTAVADRVEITCSFVCKSLHLVSLFFSCLFISLIENVCIQWDLIYMFGRNHFPLRTLITSVCIFIRTLDKLIQTHTLTNSYTYISWLHIIFIKWLCDTVMQLHSTHIFLCVHDRNASDTQSDTSNSTNEKRSERVNVKSHVLLISIYVYSFFVRLQLGVNERVRMHFWDLLNVNDL